VSGRPVCPQCNAPVEAHWDWCHACGFDPEGKKAAAEAAEAAAARPVPPPFPGAGAPGAPVGAAFPGAPGPGSPGAPSSPKRGFSTAFDDDDDLPGFGGSADVDDDPARGFPPSSNAPAESHPYEGLPYSQDVAPAPSGGLPSVPPPAPTGGPGAPGGFTPMGAGGTGFSGGGGPAAAGSHSPPGFGPGTSGYVGAGGRADAGGPGAGAGFQAGGGFSSGGPGAPGGPGGYTGPAELGTGKKPNQGKLVLIGLIGALVVVLLGVGVVKLSGSTDPSASGPTTTRDPNAPKPLGEVVPGKAGGSGSGSTPSTIGGNPNVSHPDATGGWVTYRAPDGSFQVDFPGAVRTTSRQVPINGQQQVQLDVIYDVGTEGGGFDAGYVDLESASMFADSQAALDKLNESGLNMTTIGPFPIDGKNGVHYARDVRGKQEKGVLLVIGRRLYTMAVLDVSDEDFSKFIYSFHVTA
jgi:hypothetical protein